MTGKHIHKLKKHKYKNGTAIFFCISDCNYKVEAPLALGKEVLCNICGESFIMNEYSIKLTKPHCSNCGKVQVKTDDGKKHYIPKKKANIHVLQSVAEDTTNDLKSRLEGIVKSISPEGDI